jgi:hypothetical protein
VSSAFIGLPTSKRPASRPGPAAGRSSSRPQTGVWSRSRRPLETERPASAAPTARHLQVDVPAACRPSVSACRWPIQKVCRPDSATVRRCSARRGRRPRVEAPAQVWPRTESAPRRCGPGVDRQAIGAVQPQVGVRGHPPAPP